MNGLGNPRVATLVEVSKSLRQQAEAIERIADLLKGAWHNSGVAIVRLMDHACTCPLAGRNGFREVDLECPIHRPGGFRELLNERKGPLDQEQVRTILRALGRKRRKAAGRRSYCICQHRGFDPEKKPHPECRSRRHHVRA